MSTSPTTKFRRCSSAALSPTTPSNNNTNRQTLSSSSIGRRWSFDSTREGYVKDLKKYQSNNNRDESYPLMLSEKKKKAKGSQQHNSEALSCSSSASPTTSRRIMYGRVHSMDVSSFAVPEDFELTQSSYSIFTSSCSSSGESPSLIRSIEDHRPLLSSLRQRSSSLPRILPPIFDDETEKAAHLSTHRKSIAGSLLNSPSSTMGMATTTTTGNAKYAPASTLVREMQKFVCRQAHDVSTLLPLPLPSKYSQFIKEEDEDSDNGAETLSSYQATFALINLAKVHAASLAMRRFSPQLFEDAIRTLDEHKELIHHHPHSSSIQLMHPTTSSVTSSSSPSASSPSNTASPIHHVHHQHCNQRISSAQIRREDIQDRILNSPFSTLSLRTAATAFLSSPHVGLCLNEDLNVKAINFRYSLEGEPEIVSCKFDRMSSTTVGPILSDLYTFFFNCIDPQGLSKGLVDLRELCEHYHSSLSASALVLKIQIEGLEDFEEFMEFFKGNVQAGLFIAFLLNTKKSGLHDKNEAKAKMEVFVEEMSKI